MAHDIALVLYGVSIALVMLLIISIQITAQRNYGPLTVFGIAVVYVIVGYFTFAFFDRAWERVYKTWEYPPGYTSPTAK